MPKRCRLDEFVCNHLRTDAEAEKDGDNIQQLILQWSCSAVDYPDFTRKVSERDTGRSGEPRSAAAES
jgi:hypothetical protein